jgi:hypothetical protein
MTSTNSDYERTMILQTQIVKCSVLKRHVRAPINLAISSCSTEAVCTRMPPPRLCVITAQSRLTACNQHSHAHQPTNETVYLSMYIACMHACMHIDRYIRPMNHASTLFTLWFTHSCTSDLAGISRGINSLTIQGSVTPANLDVASQVFSAFCKPRKPRFLSQNVARSFPPRATPICRESHTLLVFWLHTCGLC